MATTETPGRTLTRKQIRAMQAGRRRARRQRPQRLRETERAIDALGREYDQLRRAGRPVPWSLRDELRRLGQQRLTLKWGQS